MTESNKDNRYLKDILADDYPHPLFAFSESMTIIYWKLFQHKKLKKFMEGRSNV